MVALTPPAPSKDEVHALVELAFAWDSQGPDVPDREMVRKVVDQLTAHGRDLVVELGAMLASCPAGSSDAARAQATLREAGRRLPLPPPLALPQAVVRAQGLGRLIKALYRALSLLRDEEADGEGPCASDRGCLAEDFT
ncbi:DUF6415 family natural product biosynthesis protein [Streptomyces sp. RGM 3693]|uniref:DUF6415 family natural product biosynthesis protein n=1 Tax=Streptomyces sp. RGM 3693 TaxID=3413284 RepID=UPI003D2DF199